MNSGTLDELPNFSSLRCLLCKMGVIIPHKLAGRTKGRNKNKMLGIVSGAYCGCSVASFVSDFFVTPWTVARQAPLCMGFSRQEHWSRHFLFQGPDPGVEPLSLEAPASAGGFFTPEPPGKRPLCSG